MRARNVILYGGIVLALLLLGLLVYLRIVHTEPEIPAVTLPPTTSADRPQNGAAGASVPSQIVRVDPETVQTVIGTLHRSDSYFRTLTVNRAWSGGGSVSSISVWVRGETVRATVREGGAAAEKNVLLRDGEKWIWYSDAPEVFHGRAEDGDADAYQTLLHYEDVLALPQNSIVDAGYVDYDGEQCIYVRYVDGPLSYDHSLYISIATGLVMNELTYDGDTLVYSMSSSRPELSTPNERMFEPPTQ